jgi:transposase
VLVRVEQLRVTPDTIKRLDRLIATLVVKLPDHPLFRTLPGAGPISPPRLLAAFGEQRERFHNGAEKQKYAGIAPVTERSGKK